ncbi:hypothetical protein VPHK460_0162 [Vibrio phage K460]
MNLIINNPIPSLRSIMLFSQFQTSHLLMIMICITYYTR